MEGVQGTFAGRYLETADNLVDAIMGLIDSGQIQSVKLMNYQIH